MLPIGELNRRKEFLLKTLGKENTLFIRPDDEAKLFTGQTIELERWDKDFVKLQHMELTIVRS
jgi:hypothetical protein